MIGILHQYLTRKGDPTTPPTATIQRVPCQKVCPKGPGMRRPQRVRGLGVRYSLTDASPPALDWCCFYPPFLSKHGLTSASGEGLSLSFFPFDSR